MRRDVLVQRRVRSSCGGRRRAVPPSAERAGGLRCIVHGRPRKAGAAGECRAAPIRTTPGVWASTYGRIPSTATVDPRSPWAPRDTLPPHPPTPTSESSILAKDRRPPGETGTKKAAVPQDAALFELHLLLARNYLRMCFMKIASVFCAAASARRAASSTRPAAASARAAADSALAAAVSARCAAVIASG